MHRTFSRINRAGGVPAGVRNALAGRVARLTSPVCSRAISTTLATSAEATSLKDGATGLLESNPVQDAPLLDQTKRALIGAGISELFPVQATTLATCLAGEDILVRSKTGSGKTLGFAIPIVDALTRGKSSRVPRALVVAPTRELALQVAEETSRIARGLRVVCVFGGASRGPQAGKLERGADIVVGTPGRIIDFLDAGVLNLESIQHLVLDEADHMLERGFKEDVERILTSLPPREKRHNMLWSATVPRWVHSLSARYLNSPKFIDLVGDDAARLPASIDHNLVYLPHDREQDEMAVRTQALASVLLQLQARQRAGLLDDGDLRVLVFTQTKREAAAIARMVQRNGALPNASLLTGDLSQQQRIASLDQFKRGKSAVMVATDVAARGIDVPGVHAVVHFTPPNSTETFVHRCGRTGRAGRDGETYTIAVGRRESTLMGAAGRELGVDFNIYSKSGMDHTTKEVDKAPRETAERRRERLTREASWAVWWMDKAAQRVATIQTHEHSDDLLADEVNTAAVLNERLLESCGGDQDLALQVMMLSMLHLRREVKTPRQAVGGISPVLGSIVPERQAAAAAAGIISGRQSNVTLSMSLDDGEGDAGMSASDASDAVSAVLKRVGFRGRSPFNLWHDGSVYFDVEEETAASLLELSGQSASSIGLRSGDETLLVQAATVLPAAISGRSSLLSEPGSVRGGRYNDRAPHGRGGGGGSRYNGRGGWGGGGGGYRGGNDSRGGDFRRRGQGWTDSQSSYRTEGGSYGDRRRSQGGDRGSRSGRWGGQQQQQSDRGYQHPSSDRYFQDF